MLKRRYASGSVNTKAINKDFRAVSGGYQGMSCIIFAGRQVKAKSFQRKLAEDRARAMRPISAQPSHGKFYFLTVF